MAAPAAPTKATKGSGTKLNPVDTDRLWRDRVHGELSQMRVLAEETKSMAVFTTTWKANSPSTSIERNRSPSWNNNDASPPPPTNTNYSPELENYGNGGHPGYSGFKSTVQAAYGNVRRSLELKDGHPFNRKKQPS